jgi:hypothetical protein
VRLATIEVPVSGNQNPRLNLPEAIEHALNAEIGRAGRPHGADRGAPERRDHRLRKVGNEPRDAIASLDARPSQGFRKTSGVSSKFARADGPMHLVLAIENQRRAIVVAAQQVLGEVEPGAREEPRAGHAIEALGDVRAFRAANACEIPDRGPERIRPFERELIERGVVAQADPPPVLERVSERRDVGRRDAFGRRSPERSGHSPGL